MTRTVFQQVQPQDYTSSSFAPGSGVLTGPDISQISQNLTPLDASQLDQDAAMSRNENLDHDVGMGDSSSRTIAGRGATNQQTQIVSGAANDNTVANTSTDTVKTTIHHPSPAQTNNSMPETRAQDHFQSTTNSPNAIETLAWQRWTELEEYAGLNMSYNSFHNLVANAYQHKNNNSAIPAHAPIQHNPPLSHDSNSAEGDISTHEDQARGYWLRIADLASSLPGPEISLADVAEEGALAGAAVMERRENGDPVSSDKYQEAPLTYTELVARVLFAEAEVARLLRDIGRGVEDGHGDTTGSQHRALELDGGAGDAVAAGADSDTGLKKGFGHSMRVRDSDWSITSRRYAHRDRFRCHLLHT